MKAISTIAVFFLGALNGSAWGPDGHMIVASIAWNKLNDGVKTKLALLLQENPYYDRWTQDVAEADRAQIAFINAATWPDDIKGDSNYDNSEGEHPKKGAQSGQNIGYDDKLQHRYWHFYDTAFEAETVKASALKKVPDKVNARTQIVKFTEYIKTGSDDSIRSYDVVWLIHLVGDVHQPLHATTRFDKQDPSGDQGGNRVHLCSANQMATNPKKCRSELHGFWDGVPGSNKGVEAAEKQAAKLAEASASDAAVTDPAQWIDESFQLAKQWAYHEPVGIGDGPFVLTADYRAQARDVVHARLALAGARLANLLNNNLTTSH